MRKITKKALTGTAVAATAVALTALPASAGPLGTWTATPGGSITGNNSQVLRALNPHDGVSVVCPISTASGTLQSGSGLSGTAIASLTSVTASGCSAIGIASATITATHLPWQFNASSYDGSDVVTGTLTGVQATATINTVPQCTVTVGGPGGGGATINGTFTNSTDTLDVTTGNVTVQSISAGNPSPCAGLAHVGDAIVLAGQYQLTSDQTITSP